MNRSIGIRQGAGNNYFAGSCSGHKLGSSALRALNGAQASGLSHPESIVQNIGLYAYEFLHKGGEDYVFMQVWPAIIAFDTSR